MTETMITIPASLIEDLRLEYPPWKRTPAIRALLAQTTLEPTVSPLCLSGHDALTAGGQCRRCGVQVVEVQTLSAPQRPEDMAPFTEFTADTWPGAMPVRWRLEPDGWFSRVISGGRSYFPECPFDPSTTRDVTPPKETP